MSWDTLLTNVHLATMDPDNGETFGTLKGHDKGMDALAVSDGKIAWLGPESTLPTDRAETVNKAIDGNGCWVTPGLIDCHTHLVYGGNRAEEFALRCAGASYEEIARAGGGILSTVRATRAASESELQNSAQGRLNQLHREGVTGIEIKSGYGLDLENELKMLRVIQQLKQSFPGTIRATFLGAHALPPEFADNDAYLDYVIDTMLPEVARQQLADAVDVFCEGIAFSPDQCKKLFLAAGEHGLAIKAHAEQLSNLHGAALAADHSAVSVDHLEYLDQKDIPKLKAAGTVAVLLPGAFYFLKETRLPPIRALREAEVPIALATDSNPGSSPCCSLLLMLNMACTLFSMTAEEALAGITRHAATALGWPDRGILAVGKRADMVLWDIKHPAELAYHLGVNPCRQVIISGETVLDRSQAQ